MKFSLVAKKYKFIFCYPCWYISRASRMGGLIFHRTFVVAGVTSQRSERKRIRMCGWVHDCPFFTKYRAVPLSPYFPGLHLGFLEHTYKFFSMYVEIVLTGHVPCTLNYFSASFLVSILSIVPTTYDGIRLNTTRYVPGIRGMTRGVWQILVLLLLPVLLIPVATTTMGVSVRTIGNLDGFSFLVDQNIPVHTWYLFHLPSTGTQ